MKMGDTTPTGKKVSIYPQDSIGENLENLTSMMYNNKKVRNHLSLRFIQKEEEDKEGKTLATEIEVEIMIGKDEISDKPRIDAEMVTEEVIIDKTLVEVMIEIEEGKTLGEIIIIMTEVDQEKEAPHPEGILIDDIIAQAQIQNLGVDQILG